jgi:hypothetical protein
MRILLLPAVLLTAACATSTAGLGEKSPSLVFEGTRPAEETANCLASVLQGNNPLLKMGADHFVVTRPNAYGIPVVRWDVYGTPTGNRVELRASFGINVGEPKARTCAGAPAA